MSRRGNKLARIRPTDKLPSGVFGWYIYPQVDSEKVFVVSPCDFCGISSVSHSKEDLIVLRDIFTKLIEEMEAKR